MLRGLVFHAVRNLEACVRTDAPRGRAVVARWALALAGLTLEELGSDEMARRFASALETVPVMA